MHTEILVIVPVTKNNIAIRGIWDTGATNSLVTQKVVDALGLIPSGKVQSKSVNV